MNREMLEKVLDGDKIELINKEGLLLFINLIHVQGDDKDDDFILCKFYGGYGEAYDIDFVEENPELFFKEIEDNFKL